MRNISPERQMIAKVFKKHIEQAIYEIGKGYTVDLQGEFDKTPIKITVQISAKDEIP
jgi:hypothetical protein